MNVSSANKMKKEETSNVNIEIEKVIGVRVKKLMQENDLTIRELSDLLGLSVGGLHKLLSGEGAWRATHLIKLTNILATDLEKIIMPPKEIINELNAEIYSRVEINQQKVLEKELEIVAERKEKYSALKKNLKKK